MAADSLYGTCRHFCSLSVEASKRTYLESLSKEELVNLLCQKDGKIAELEACILKLLTHIKHCLNTNAIAASANEKSLADMSTRLMEWR